jgi:hypothetical protein
MKDDQALRPEALSFKNFEVVKKPEIDDTAEEQILANGADNTFWKIVRGYFDNSIQQLEQINEQAIAQGLPFDEIGRNALVISQVKGVLRKITNVVEDAKESQDGKQK